jgi:beta-glucosidase/6-phospho-beta-glucosidase/beta-galactosidase
LFHDGSAEQATDVASLRNYADPVALAHYHAYFDALAARGLHPLVTLDHYTLPLWLHNGKECHDDLENCADKGWMDKDRLLPAIALYSAFCAEEFGDQIDSWATLNEPLAVVLSGYLLPSADRTNPPGVTNPAAAVAVLFAQAEGHIAMYDAIKAHDTVDADGDGEASSVGVVDNLVAIAGEDPSNPLDQAGIEAADYVYNRAFLNAAIKGEFDRDMDGVAEEVHPEMAGKMDYLGVNYYTRITVRGMTVPLFAGYDSFTFYPSVVFEDYPEGLYDVTVLGASYGLPVIITESGRAEPDENTGETWLRPHLQALHRAYAEGVDVRGFFYWSLMDNYEWNHGMDMHFGLYAVDIASKARTLRPLGEDYRTMIQSGI